MGEDQRLEIKSLKERITELEKWLVVMLNNFYEQGSPNMQNLEGAIRSIDEL